jgi:hypothetical protein
LLLATAACRGDDGPRQITQTREIVATPGSVVIGATSRDRFGDPFAHGGAAEKPEDVQRELVWDVPAGWKELPPTEMRRANLQPAGSPDAECALFVLPGEGGGLLDNVNRWRVKQFGAPPLLAADLEKLPKQKLMGLDATRVEVEGTYQGMTATGTAGEAKPGFALVGLIAQVQERLLAVKMTGPKTLVDAERGHFDDFVKSLRIETNGAANAHGHDGASPSGGGAPGDSSASFTFTTPTGWSASSKSKSTMRLATLVPAGAKESECAIFVMPGDAGGVAANVNRWRKQMGLGELSADGLAALPKATLCGRDATLLDVTGEFSDSMNSRTIAKARFLGAIALVDDQTVFLKLTGPQSELTDAVKEQFLALCSSLAPASGK